MTQPTLAQRLLGGSRKAQPEAVFLSADDAQHYKAVLSALTRERRSAALIGSNATLMSHYSDMVIQALRKLPSVKAELYLPSTTETLLSRFNDLLEGKSMTSARHSLGETQALRIWIVHAARSADVREAQLLARLVTDFPGAQVALLMLLDGEASQSMDLDRMGAKLHRWSVDLPHEREFNVALSCESSATRKSAMKELMQRCTWAAGQAKAVPTDDSPAPRTAASPQRPEASAARTAPAAPRSTTSPADAPQSLRSAFSLSKGGGVMQRQVAADQAAKKAPARSSSGKATASTPPTRRLGIWQTLRSHPRVVVVGLLILLVSAEVAWLLHEPSAKSTQAQAPASVSKLASAADWLPKKCRLLEALHLGQCQSSAV